MVSYNVRVTLFCLFTSQLRTPAADIDYDSSLDGLVLEFGMDGPETRPVEVFIIDDNFYEGTETFMAVVTTNDPGIAETPGPGNMATVAISDDESMLRLKNTHTRVNKVDRLCCNCLHKTQVLLSRFNLLI